MGSLHFNLTESDIRQVFEPFGELEFVDLHRDPVTGRSKGYAFVQWVSLVIISRSAPPDRCFTLGINAQKTQKWP